MVRDAASIRVASRRAVLQVGQRQLDRLVRRRRPVAEIGAGQDDRLDRSIGRDRGIHHGKGRLRRGDRRQPDVKHRPLRTGPADDDKRQQRGSHRSRYTYPQVAAMAGGLSI